MSQEVGADAATCKHRTLRHTLRGGGLMTSSNVHPLEGEDRRSQGGT